MLYDEVNKLLPYFEDGTYLGNYQNVSYEAAYHTSKLRENLINWYPFNKKASVLVLSCGMGALIPYLCKNTAYVTVLEKDKANREIIEKRCAEFSNLKVISEDFMEYSISQKFDYVLAIDYLSEHLKYDSGTNWIEKFLLKVYETIDEDGKLLIALNNTLGLKYFNGAFCESKELNLFDNLKQPDFFTKKELITLFEKSRLPYYKFYYPFPDYVFPRSIYTDMSLKTMRFGHHYNDYPRDRYRFFDEFRMYQTLQENDIVDKFSNSFFIEVAKNPFVDNEVIYAKNQYFIDKKFKTVTIVYSGIEKRAEKKALTPEAAEYLFNFYKDSVKLNSSSHCFDYISYSYNNDSDILQMPYIEGQSVCEQLERKINELEKGGNFDLIYKDIVSILSDIYKQMKLEAHIKKPDEIYNEEFQEYFGNEIIHEPLYCLNPVTLDMHLDHIFPFEDGFHVIDIDPIKFFNVPIDYLMWCLIESWHYTYIYKNKFLEHLISIEELCNVLGILNTNIPIFKNWRNNVYNNQSAVSQIQPFYSRYFEPLFFSYDKLTEYGQLKGSDSRVMSAIKKNVTDTFRLDKETPVILYGASAVGKLFYNILFKRGYKICAFIDKRYDEISDIEGCPVIDPNSPIDNNCIIIVAIKNVFEQEKIAKQLFKKGCNKLIYRPQKIVEGMEDKTLQIINNAYDEIERFKWISDPSIPLNLDYDIPKTNDFPKITLKDSAIKIVQEDKIIANIPITNIFTAQQQLMPDYPWAEKSIISLIPHTALYKYLWDGGEDRTEWYIDFCSYGARNNNIKITEKWKQNLIDNRLIVLSAMKKSLEQDFDFFYRNPPEGLWNDDKNYFNLNGGRHRAALFVYENFYTMPLKMGKDDYNKFLNMNALKKVERYMQNEDMDSLEVPISHPYFLNLSCRRPQYYHNVIKPVIEFLSKCDIEQSGVVSFEGYSFEIYAEDHGEIKRCLSKLGFDTINIGKQTVFEELLDELFYYDSEKNMSSTKKHLFADISLTGFSALTHIINLDHQPDISFVLLDKKDMEKTKDFFSQYKFSIVKTLKHCYWDLQNIMLLVFEKEN